jgi:hypothetical protein
MITAIHVEVVERLGNYTLLSCRLETGRPNPPDSDSPCRTWPPDLRRDTTQQNPCDVSTPDATNQTRIPHPWINIRLMPFH